jgi:4-amino-4-deoxy-L-arabinose transferase-like glycosyltransferase
VAAVLLACAVPLVFYSLSGSKLPPYILPVIVPLLALACAFEKEGEETRALGRSGWELLGLGLLLLVVVPFVLKEKEAVGWVLAVGAAFTGLGCWALRPRELTGPRWQAALGAALLLLVVAAGKVAGPGKAVTALVRQAPPEAQWISCGNLFQGIPFVTGRRMTVVAGTGELAFGRDHLKATERDRWFQEEPRALAAVALALRAEDPSRPVWALVDRSTWKNDLDSDQRAPWAVEGGSRSSVLVRLR